MSFCQWKMKRGKCSIMLMFCISWSNIVTITLITQSCIFCRMFLSLSGFNSYSNFTYPCVTPAIISLCHLQPLFPCVTPAIISLYVYTIPPISSAFCLAQYECPFILPYTYTVIANMNILGEFLCSQNEAGVDPKLRVC